MRGRKIANQAASVAGLLLATGMAAYGSYLMTADGHYGFAAGMLMGIIYGAFMLYFGNALWRELRGSKAPKGKPVG